MRHFLYRIYTEEEGNMEILVGADCIREADYILAQDETITMFTYLDELTESEAEDSGLDEL
jgi:hypothetical protein